MEAFRSFKLVSPIFHIYCLAIFFFMCISIALCGLLFAHHHVFQLDSLLFVLSIVTVTVVVVDVVVVIIVVVLFCLINQLVSKLIYIYIYIINYENPHISLSH